MNVLFARGSMPCGRAHTSIKAPGALLPTHTTSSHVSLSRGYLTSSSWSRCIESLCGEITSSERACKRGGEARTAGHASRLPLLRYMCLESAESVRKSFSKRAKLSRIWEYKCSHKTILTHTHRRGSLLLAATGLGRPGCAFLL